MVTTLPPLTVEIPMPTAGSPLKKSISEGGSFFVKVTVAMSPSVIRRSVLRVITIFRITSGVMFPASILIGSHSPPMPTQPSFVTRLRSFRIL